MMIARLCNERIPILVHTDTGVGEVWYVGLMRAPRCL